VAAIIIPWDGELGVSYTYPSGPAEAGPIGPEDWPAIQALERECKLSFTRCRNGPFTARSVQGPLRHLARPTTTTVMASEGVAA